MPRASRRTVVSLLLCVAALATGGTAGRVRAAGDHEPANGAAAKKHPAPAATVRTATTTTTATATATATTIPALPDLAVPVAGVSTSALRDTYTDPRAGHPHEAIDIAAPTGTPVYAVDDGTVAKLFNSVPGGLTVYQFDRSSTLAYYYAHLDRYADGLRAGKPLARCELIGYVGTTGNAAADAPHLHFAVFALGPERQWWKGTPLNPYAALTGRGTAAAVASATAGPTPSRCD